MNISLGTLIEIGACREARAAFVDKFGKDGKPTAKEVFVALAEGKQSYWLFWLAASLDGFIQAVGDFSSGNFYCAVSGEIDVTTGFVVATDNATVRAYGNATVLLTRFSLGVSLKIKSDGACAVDRRNGPPRLITQTTE